MIALGDLAKMDRAALVAAWIDIFGRPAPKGMSQGFLRRFLAFEIQARANGGLPKSTLRALTTSSETKPPTASPKMVPGARLLREWNGTTHVVDVTGTGFAWKGKTYRSLSRIAREITGAHWSGPRFFGLTTGTTR